MDVPQNIPNAQHSKTGLEISEEAAQSIIQSVLTSEELKKKTNKEIAELLTDHVWAQLPIFAAQSDLISEAIDRLNA